MADKKLIDNSSATTVDNFYGNNGGADVQIPLADAAAVLAERTIISINESSDLNTCTRQGYVYSWGSNSPANAPFGYGNMINCFVNSGIDSFTQICILRSQAAQIAIRIKDGGKFGGWYKFSLTAI